MKFSKQVTLLVIAVVATAVLAVGVTAAVTAGASTGGTTYNACLKSGKLIDVGVATPTCPGGASPISWNSQGSAGPTGPQGPVGQASVVNAAAVSEFASACPEPPGPSNSDGPSSSGAAAFLNIPSIPGESTDPNHTGQIDVLSWSFGVAGSGGGAGCTASHSSSGQGAVSGLQFSIVKNVDKSSPQLMLSAGTSANLGSVTLSLRKSGATQDYLTYTFKNTVVTGVQWAHGEDSLPQEEVTFQYTAMSISYTQQNSDGSYASPTVTCLDISIQQPC
jgi:type VI secretion system secreted protein Hcp